MSSTDSRIPDSASSVDWTNADAPMTPEQSSELKSLCEQAGEPDLFDAKLTSGEAAQRIAEMRETLGLG